jgi:hypothetical protein
LGAENTLKLMENISMRLQGKFHNNTLKDCFVSSSKTKTNMTRMSAVVALSEHVGNCGLSSPQPHENFIDVCCWSIPLEYDTNDSNKTCD